jgi:hypothetical protein
MKTVALPENGSFLAEKPRISWGHPDFQKAAKALGLGYDHRAWCQRLEISGTSKILGPLLRLCCASHA